MESADFLKGLKIVFMGTPEFAVPILHDIIESRLRIAGVITSPVAFFVYASDRSLISTGARPHAGPNRRRRAASLDHSLWLHHAARFDDWHLFVMVSPAAHAARALVHGAIYRRDGTRVALVSQEGLIRYEEGDLIR